jgi:hypothetical protein
MRRLKALRVLAGRMEGVADDAVHRLRFQVCGGRGWVVWRGLWMGLGD